LTDRMNEALPLISIVIAATAVGISICSFRKTQRANIMPVLVFTRRSESRWQIENVGQGPALSITVGDKEQSGQWRWRVRCFPIAAGASIELPWPTAGDQFVASYTNVRGKAYSTLCSMNENHFFEKNKFPDLIPTIDEWSLQAMIQEYRRKF